MLPGVLSTAPPANQQTPGGQNCRDERELISWLNVLLGGGEVLFCFCRKLSFSGDGKQEMCQETIRELVYVVVPGSKQEACGSMCA